MRSNGINTLLLGDDRAPHLDLDEVGMLLSPEDSEPLDFRALDQVFANTHYEVRRISERLAVLVLRFLATSSDLPSPR